ncbi:MAG: hypothetical protein AABZ39_03820, partial [Spirochaetota bacterium]
NASGLAVTNAPATNAVRAARREVSNSLANMFIPAPVQPKYDTSKFVKYAWRFPDYRYYRVEKEEYSLDEVKSMIDGDPDNPVLVRIIEKPVMQFSYTPVPDAAKEALSFGVGSFSNNASGTNIGMTDRKRLAEWSDLTLSFSPALAKADNAEAVARLFDYLAGFGICRKAAGAGINYRFSHFYYTENYSNIMDAFSKMNHIPDDVRYRMEDSFRTQYDISKKIIEFRLALMNGLTALPDVENVPFRSMEGADPVFLYWLEQQPLIDSEHIFDELVTRSKVVMRQFIDQKIAELLQAEDAADMRRRLSVMGIKEAVGFSEFFARSRFQYFEGTIGRKELAQQRLDQTGRNRVQVMDVKVLTSLTTYVLDQIVRPVNTNLAGWRFGSVDDTRTRHRYMVGMKPYVDGGRTKFVIMYFDPALLAEFSMAQFTNQNGPIVMSRSRAAQIDFDRIVRSSDVIWNRNQFFYVQRYSEDLIQSTINADIAFPTLDTR